jgi:hypothetical protein
MQPRYDIWEKISRLDAALSRGMAIVDVRPAISGRTSFRHVSAR